MKKPKVGIRIKTKIEGHDEGHGEGHGEGQGEGRDRDQDQDQGQGQDQNQDEDQDEGQGEGQDDGQGYLDANYGRPLDTHDLEGDKDLTPEEIRERDQEIRDRLQEYSINKTRGLGNGNATSIDVDGALAPRIDWRQKLRDLLFQMRAGSDFRLMGTS